MPDVSVLMSVFNGERYLRQAVDSILNQTFTNFEFIIVDDGSADSTWDNLSEYASHDRRIVLIRNEKNIGLTKSLNKGMRIAQGKYIARQDADDISLADRLERQAEFLDNHTDVVIVGSDCYTMDENGNHTGTYLYPKSDTEIRWLMLFQCNFAHPSVMLRADVLAQNGLRYDNKAVHAQDYELWSRLLSYGKGRNLSPPLVKLRIHADRISQTKASQQKALANSIAQSNVELFGFHISKADVTIIRNFTKRLLPRSLTRRNMELCRVLLQILRTFENLPQVDPVIARRIRRRWVSRLMDGVTKQNLGAFLTSRLAREILRCEPRVVARHLANVGTRRISRS